MGVSVAGMGVIDAVVRVAYVRIGVSVAGMGVANAGMGVADAGMGVHVAVPIRGQHLLNSCSRLQVVIEKVQVVTE